MKLLFSIIFALTFTSFISAQDSDKKMKREERRLERRANMESKMQSQKIAFITQKLDLTPTEAQSFWPNYNEYQDQLKQLRDQKREDLNSEDLSDQNANAFLDNIFKIEQKELDLKEEYFAKFKSSLPIKKVAKLFIIEKQFRDEVLNKIKSRMNKRNRKAKEKGRK